MYTDAVHTPMVPRCARSLPVAPFVAVLVAMLGVTSSLGAQHFRDVEKRKLRHILVQSEAQADSLLRELQEGADFITLARRSSFDVLTKRLGGDLGWSAKNAYDPGFDSVAFSIAEKGQIAKAQSQYGWHLILLEDVMVEQIQIRPPTPPTTPTQPRPMPTPVKRIEKLDATLALERTAYAPGEDIFFTITLRNRTQLGEKGTDQAGERVQEGEPINVFHPALWPCGITVRYEKGSNNRELKFTPVTSGDPVFLLEPGQSHTERYRLQDYFPEADPWPLVRMNWRGNELVRRIAELHPELAKQDEWSGWQETLQIIYGEEDHFNVLPAYRPGDEWYVLFYISGGELWLKIEDPGVPGLVEHWLDLVRNERIERVPFEDLVAGSHLRSGASPVAQRHTKGFQLPSGWDRRLPPVGPNTVALGVDRGTPDHVNSQVYLALGAPELGHRAISLGRITLGERTLERVVAAMEAGGPRKPMITRLDAYPVTLIPERLRKMLTQDGHEAARAEVEGAARPATGTSPGAEPPAPRSERPEARREPELKPLADDLPRVELHTTHGTLTLELFEDHAPNTVAHFLSLVEEGYYEQSQVSHVEAGAYVQLGSTDGSRASGPPYYVPDELNAMKHVPGAVALARIWKRPDTGGCQFLICMDRQAEFDEDFTVFGRVVEGGESVRQLQVGDYLKGVRVLRKRDHAYEVKQIPRE